MATKKAAPKADTNGTVSGDAIPLHKKLAMGQKPVTGAESGPKTPA